MPLLQIPHRQRPVTFILRFANRVMIQVVEIINSRRGRQRIRLGGPNPAAAEFYQAVLMNKNATYIMASVRKRCPDISPSLLDSRLRYRPSGFEPSILNRPPRCNHYILSRRRGWDRLWDPGPLQQINQAEYSQPDQIGPVALIMRQADPTGNQPRTH